MTKRAVHKIPDSEFRMPMPADMPPDMPSIMREFRRPPAITSDGSPDDDSGEALFDAVVQYFKVDSDDPEAGWRLAADLLWLVLPGSHYDPRAQGARPKRDSDELVQLGEYWVGLKRIANAGKYSAGPTAVYRANEQEIHSYSRLFKTVSSGKPALNLLAKAESAYGARVARDASMQTLKRVTLSNMRKFVFTDSTETKI